MAQKDHDKYEQNEPHHEREEDFLDRAHQGLDRALRNIAEIEERMAHNIGRGMHSDRKTAR